MELITRKCKCKCGAEFKVMPQSKQKYASLDHEILDSKNGYNAIRARQARAARKAKRRRAV